MSIEIGQKAPEFTLPTDTRVSLSLSNLKGKKVVLYFYPKDDTPGCTKEACGFRDAWSELAKVNAAVIGISKDSIESHQAFKKKHDLPFTLLSDKDSQVCEQYGVIAEKEKDGRKYIGIVRTTLLIDEQGTIAAIWRNVNVDGHIADVLNYCST